MKHCKERKRKAKTRNKRERATLKEITAQLYENRMQTEIYSELRIDIIMLYKSARLQNYVMGDTTPDSNIV